MESRRAFEEAWQGVIAAGGEEKLSPPKEIVWLNGAPGAGKGANTPFILRTRGFEVWCGREGCVSKQLSPPKEIVWLNGVPGAGKGANTPFILRTRGFEGG
ncbi:unnamed protein product [Closterium sp. NIES-53]